MYRAAIGLCKGWHQLSASPILTRTRRVLPLTRGVRRRALTLAPSRTMPSVPEAILRATELLRIGRASEAIALARKAARLITDPHAKAITLGGLLVDSGTDLRKPGLIREGTTLLRGALTSVPETMEFALHYNLGNAYSAIGSWERGASPGTRPSLSEAVSHYDKALLIDPTPEVRTNLAGALAQQGRFFEALDELDALIDGNPQVHQAYAKRASALRNLFAWTQHHTALLAAASRDYEMAVSLSAHEPVFASLYQRALDQMRSRVRPILPTPTTSSADQAWIWRNRLALNPCPICRIESPDAFDLYPLPGRLQAPRRRPPVEHVLELVNSLCQSFATARWLLFTATDSGRPLEADHVISLKGLPRARHTLRIGLMMAALSGFYSVLGQAAFAMDSYLQLGHDRPHLTIDTVWGKPGRRGFPKSRKDMHPSLLRRSAQPLNALYRLAESLQHGLGRYATLRSLRNHLEHHVVVATEATVESRYFITALTPDLTSSAYSLGRIAKAAVWYLSAIILNGELERVRRHGQSRHIPYGAKGPAVDRN